MRFSGGSQRMYSLISHGRSMLSGDGEKKF
jgi:hypothetical protein